MASKKQPRIKAIIETMRSRCPECKSIHAIDRTHYSYGAFRDNCTICGFERESRTGGEFRHMKLLLCNAEDWKKDE